MMCKNCTKRTLGCHDSCEEYQTWLAGIHKAKEALSHEKWLNSNMKPENFRRKHEHRR